jgi:hypothetical protein
MCLIEIGSAGTAVPNAIAKTAATKNSFRLIEYLVLTP